MLELISSGRQKDDTKYRLMSQGGIHTHEKNMLPKWPKKKGLTHSIISNAHSTEKEFGKRTDVCKCCGPHKTLK